VIKQLKDIKTRIERRFIVTSIELDSTAAAFYISETADMHSEYEAIRIELRDLGFLAALRENESRFTLRKVIRSLATTPALREISQKVEGAREPGVRRAWIDRFFEEVSCPKCGSDLELSVGLVGCSKCSWDPSPDDPVPRHVIVVTRRPSIGFSNPRINIVLFLLTLFTTTITGSGLWMGYSNEPLGDSYIETFIIASTTLGFVARGFLYFSLPLLSIAGIHELGHYFIARRYGVHVSLPYFLPFPPIVSFLGTLGAFISIREPIPNRKALFDIGIAGPIAGFVVSIPIILIGLFLTEPFDYVYEPGQGPNFDIGLPIIFELLSNLVDSEGSLHPMAFAGWIGLLLTAMNLFPAGQLDGGHIFRATLGDRSIFLTHTTIIAITALGVLFYSGWFLIAAVILLIGVHHPPPLNDLAELGWKRKVASFLAIGMLIICIAPRPISLITYDLDVVVPDHEAGITPGGMVNFSLFVENSGDENNTYLIEQSTVPEYWVVSFDRSNLTLEPGDGYQVTQNPATPQNLSDITRNNTSTNSSTRSSSIRSSSIRSSSIRISSTRSSSNSSSSSRSSIRSSSNSSSSSRSSIRSSSIRSSSNSSSTTPSSTIPPGRVTVSIQAPQNATPGSEITIRVRIRSENGSRSIFGSEYPKKTITFLLHVGKPFDLVVKAPEGTIPIGDNETVTNVTIINSGVHPIDVNFHSVIDGNETDRWNHSLSLGNASLLPLEEITISLNVSVSNSTEGNQVKIIIIALGTVPSGDVIATGSLTFLYNSGAGATEEGSE
jgi:Zn-dependent protease